MKGDESSLFKKRIKSFLYAFDGIALLLKETFNARIHLVATIAVVVLGIYCDLPKVEWLILILCFAGVWTAEGINSAIEYVVDLETEEFHPLAKKAKDVAAGSVLIVSIAAAIIGLLIFLPYFI